MGREPAWLWPLATLCAAAWIIMAVVTAYNSGYYDGLAAASRPLPLQETEGD